MASGRKQEALVSWGCLNIQGSALHLRRSVGSAPLRKTSSPVSHRNPTSCGAGAVWELSPPHTHTLFWVLPPSSPRFGNALTLAAPESERRVFSVSALPRERSPSSEQLHINKDRDLHKESAPGDYLPMKKNLLRVFFFF